MNHDSFWITPSDVLEFLFCPRFIYYMKVLNIVQHEEKRFLVQKGRKIHEEHMKINQKYLRKKLNVVKKLTDIKLYSSKYKILGIVDEIIFMQDGTASPIDYKYAFHKWNFNTYYFQGLMYCLMIEENYNTVSRKAYVCFSRDKWHLEEIEYDDLAIAKLEKILENIVDIVKKGIIPKKRATKRKCIDCTYRRLCV